MSEATEATAGAPDDSDAEATRTVRRGLRDRRDKAVQTLSLDRRVPRLDPPVFVRFKPLTGARIEQINKAAEKSKDPDASTIGNATALADACVGIFEVVDGRKVSIDPDGAEDDWPRFDARLAGLLGLPEGITSASTIVRALYLTDGDITSEAGAVTAWSGFAGEEALEEFAGN